MKKLFIFSFALFLMNDALTQTKHSKKLSRDSVFVRHFDSIITDLLPRLDSMIDDVHYVLEDTTIIIRKDTTIVDCHCDAIEENINHATNKLIDSLKVFFNCFVSVNQSDTFLKIKEKYKCQELIDVESGMLVFNSKNKLLENLLYKIQDAEVRIIDLQECLGELRALQH